ncbi:MAG: hypothetical protein WC272_09785, partial [Sulfurimonas sp.]
MDKDKNNETKINKTEKNMKNRVQISLVATLLLSTTLVAQSSHALKQIEVDEKDSSSRGISQNEAFSAPESSKLTIDKLTE